MESIEVKQNNYSISTNKTQLDIGFTPLKDAERFMQIKIENPYESGN